MSTKSKFAALLESRRTETPEEAKPTESISVDEQKSTEEPMQISKPDKRPRGRPGGQGKRANPDYTQVTAYIPENLHLETKIKLLLNGKREFSELIEELLEQWNRTHSMPHST